VENPLLMSREDVCRVLSIRPSKRDQLIASGELVKVKIGSRALVTVASVQAYVDRLIEEANAANAS
jgi:hypothetical protein